MKKSKIKKLIRKEINKILPFLIEELLNAVKYQNIYNKSDDIGKVENVDNKSNTTFDEDVRFDNIKKEYPEIDEIKNKVQQTFFPSGVETRFVNYLAEAVLLNKRIIKRDGNWKGEYYKNLFNEFKKIVDDYNDVYYNKAKKELSLNNELNNISTTLNDLKKESIINNNNKLVIDLDELKKENFEQKINNMTNEANNS